MSRYFKRHRGRLAIWMLMEFLVALAMVWWSFFMKGLSDTAFGGQGLEGIKNLLLLGLLFLFFFLPVQYSTFRCRASFLRACNASLREDLFNRIIHYDINTFSSSNSAKYISLLNNDVTFIDQNYFRIVPEIVSYLIQFVVATITMFYFNVWLALITLAVSIIPIVPTLRFGGRASDGQKDYMNALDHLNAEIKDMFTGFEVVKSFHAEDKILEKFKKAVQSVESANFRIRNEQGKSISAGYTLGYLGSIVQLVFSVFLVIRGDITLGVLMGTMQISNFVSNPARNAVSDYLVCRTVRPVAERILAVLDGKDIETIQDSPSESCEISSAGTIQVEELAFSYQKDQEILHDLNYQFCPGKKYAVVGGSGSGKTTFIRLLMGYYSNYRGTVQYNGISLSQIDRTSLYRHVAMIHQKVFLFEDTIRNNITMFQPYSEEQVWQAVRDAGLTEVVQRMGGLDAMVDENGHNLSGGEQQRVSIARAFIRGTDVMLVDEATASLDPQTAHQIHQTLLRKEGLTLIAVTHQTDEALMRDYDEVLVLEAGILLEHGPYDSLSPQQKRLMKLR